MAFTDSPAMRGQRKEGGVKRVRVNVRVNVRVKEKKRGRVNPTTRDTLLRGSVGEHTDSGGSSSPTNPRDLMLSRVIVGDASSLPAFALLTAGATIFFDGLLGVSIVGNRLGRFRSLRIITRLLHGVFGLTIGVLHLAFGLLCGTLDLGAGVACPFSRLTFNAACDILDFSLDAILIHFVILPVNSLSTVGDLIGSRGH